MTEFDADVIAALRAASHQLAVAADALATQAAQPVAPVSISTGSSDLLRIREVSDLTGIPVNTLRSWRQGGTGPVSHRLGGRVVYRRSDVEAWKQSQLASNAG